MCYVLGLLDADIAMEKVLPADQTMEKVKKRYRKKKTKLEEAFPSYLQVTHTHKYSHTQQHTRPLSISQGSDRPSLSSSRRRSSVGIFWTGAGRWRGGQGLRRQVAVNQEQQPAT